MRSIVTARDARTPAILFASFATFYALLRSKNIFAVDGAHRCFEVYRRQTLFFHPNNHLLYPVNVLVWSRIASVLGLRENGPLQFFSTIQLMNCFAAAGCVALLYFLMYQVIPSWRLCLGVAVGYGFCKAVLEQATNANEPLMGVLWSLLAISCAALSLKVKSNWPLLVSGFLFSLALATYESTVFLGPAAIVLIVQNSLNDDGHPVHPNRWLRVGALAMGGLAGCVLIYGGAYYFEGLRTPFSMLRRFLVLETGRVYYGASGGKLLNVPVGLIHNIFPTLKNYTGLRNLLEGPISSLVSFGFFLLLFFTLLVFGLRQIWKCRTSMPGPLKAGLLSATVGFVFTMIPILIWDPQYDKLWLQPLACLAYLSAIALYLIGQDPRNHFRISKVLPVVVLIGCLSNVTWAVYDHAHETQGMQEAQRVAGIVGKQDLVVGGWDNVSLLYSDIWRSQTQFIDFTSESVSYGKDVTARLNESVLKAEERGGRVYFLGVVDIPKKAWDSYLGIRCGVPFSELALYRANSSTVAKFESGSIDVTLWQFDLATVKPALAAPNEKF
ncbi:MAG: hypothetical protein ACRD5M_14820 [Candidatus Acidiferrales bacterium]